MNLQELKQQVDLAIKDCQQVIIQNPKAVLSEGDFEKLLADCISERIGYDASNPNPNNFGVFTQMTHYNNLTDRRNAYSDILIVKPCDIQSGGNKSKGYIIPQSKESFAIELKYSHGNNRKCVTGAQKDIDKFEKYKDDSHYYVIALLSNNPETSNDETDILNYYKEKIEEFGEECKNKFFCKVLVKGTE